MSIIPELQAKIAELETANQALRRAQDYVYIGKDGKAVKARDLEDQLIALKPETDHARWALIQAHLDPEELNAFMMLIEQADHSVSNLESKGYHTDAVALKKIKLRCQRVLGKPYSTTYEVQMTYMGKKMHGTVTEYSPVDTEEEADHISVYVVERIEWDEDDGDTEVDEIEDYEFPVEHLDLASEMAEALGEKYDTIPEFY